MARLFQVMSQLDLLQGNLNLFLVANTCSVAGENIFKLSNCDNFWNSSCVLTIEPHITFVIFWISVYLFVVFNSSVLEHIFVLIVYRTLVSFLYCYYASGGIHSADLARIKNGDDWLRRFLLHNDRDMKETMSMAWETFKWRKTFGTNGKFSSYFPIFSLLLNWKSQILIFCRYHWAEYKGRLFGRWKHVQSQQGQGWKVVVHFEMQEAYKRSAWSWGAQEMSCVLVWTVG